MFRHRTAWTILTSGLIGLSTTALVACGGQDPSNTKSHKRAPTPAMPSVASHDNSLTAVQPSAPAVTADDKTEAPAPIEKPAPAEPTAAAKDDAEARLDKLALAARRTPDDVHARVALAKALFHAGKIDEAQDSAEKAIDLDADSGAAWYVLGRVQMSRNDLDAAAESFQHVVAGDQDNSYAWNNLGYIRIQEGQWDQAAAALENATSGVKPTGYMWNNLGMAYEHLNRIREARAAYRLAADAGSDKGTANLSRLEGVGKLLLDQDGNAIESTAGEDGAMDGISNAGNQDAVDPIPGIE